MESFGLGSEDADAELYLSLGLKGKRNGGIPRVLSIISSLLERSVQKNEKISETGRKKDVITVFHGLRAPALSIREYLDRIFKYSSCSPSCFVIAHIYIDRFLKSANIRLNSLNVHRILITSVMVAAKFIDDKYFNNAYYARVGGVSTSEMNRLELKFLFSLDFRLQVTVDEFRRHCFVLEKEAKGGGYHQIERPIQICRVKEGWQNNVEDANCKVNIQQLTCGS
ncbi:hypothetical protein ACHQM5_027111 [Ranunculus cassubicifolius]